MHAPLEFYTLIKVAHILSATVLFGTGLGTAFFMFRSRSFVDVRSRYDTARSTVLADCMFTLPAGILQLLTGFALISIVDFDPLELWLVASYGLFTLALLCWLPVVWIQIRLKYFLKVSLETGAEVPDEYHRLYRIWFYLGWPAFIALVMIFYLMVAKPTW